MCIIVYKPAGVDMPADDTLITCFENNPDGAGYMYQDVVGVHIAKGFMQVDDLLNSLYELNEHRNLKKTALVLHFRFATQGAISPGNCHPFPISAKKSILRKKEVLAPIGMAHNGIIRFCEKRGAQLSDTALFVQKYLSQIPQEVLFNKALLDLVEIAAGGKFVFMSTSDVAVIGDFTKDKGVYYSNDGYKPFVRAHYGYGGHYGHGYDYDYGDYFFDDGVQNPHKTYDSLYRHEDKCDICGEWGPGDTIDDGGIYFICLECQAAFSIYVTPTTNMVK